MFTWFVLEAALEAGRKGWKSGGLGTVCGDSEAGGEELEAFEVGEAGGVEWHLK
jgi:hypothetical protein